MVMLASIINMALLLPQSNPSIKWQKWTGVNLTSGKFDPVIKQAQDFVNVVKQGGSDVTMYSMTLNMVDTDFQATINANYVIPPMPVVTIFRPVDWQRPSAFRKEEMLSTDYWLFKPVRDTYFLSSKNTTPAIDNFDQETMLFQAWATQLTTKEGVTVVSDTPTARVLRIVDRTLLEPALDELVKKYRWRKTFVEANPKRLYNEKELTEALLLHPPVLENVTFGGMFFLRALSVSRNADDITVRFWWNPLTFPIERDWIFFIHTINDKGEMVLNNQAPIHFNKSSPTDDVAFMFDQVTFKSPVSNGMHRLAIGFYRAKQKTPLADKGGRDWGNRRVIVPLP